MNPRSDSYTIHPVSLGKVKCYLVYSGQQAILIDCGNRGSEKKILNELDRLGIKPGVLSLLILTHVHYDHAGAAARLKELTGCKIAVQELDADHLMRGKTPFPGGTRWKPRILVLLGKVFARSMMKFPAVTPDLIIGESLDLDGFGFPAKVIHTPGHTPGSVVVLFDGGELISGDTFFGLYNKEHFPPFAVDRIALISSWEKIRELPFQTIYPAHGQAIPVGSFQRELEIARVKYGH